MTIKKRWIAFIAGFVVTGAASFAFAFPAPTACLAIDAYGFEAVSERFLIPANSSRTEREMFGVLVRQAKERIANTFGPPEAEPIIVFFNDPRAFWPLHLNLHGQAPSIGSRACLIIGPNGQNVDTVAHELMHAELLRRVGPWRLFRDVPAWFNEGVAMQVDYRERFDMSREQLPDTTYVRELFSYREFFQGQNSYSAAKREVHNWLAEVGANTLYLRLDRLQKGEGFAQAIEQ